MSTGIPILPLMAKQGRLLGTSLRGASQFTLLTPCVIDDVMKIAVSMCVASRYWCATRQQLMFSIAHSRVIDTLHQAFVLHLGYNYLITHFGDYTVPYTSLPW